MEDLSKLKELLESKDKNDALIRIEKTGNNVQMILAGPVMMNIQLLCEAMIEQAGKIGMPTYMLHACLDVTVQGRKEKDNADDSE